MAADLPLVGRRAELAVLTSALAPGPGPRVVVLVGEAGVGKTRLIGEAVRRCGAAGVRTLVGGCLPLAENVPFLPITEALHGLSPDGPPAALDRCAAHVRTELARLMPGWTDTAVPEPSADWARGRLFAALRDLCAALTAEGPHALVVEDMHWADPSTLDLLAYLGAVDETIPILLTCREEEIDPARRVGSWLAELDRRPGLTRLSLARLSRTEVAEHVGALLGTAAAGLLIGLGRTSEARAALEQGLAACRAAEIVPERVKVLRDLAVLSEHNGDIETGERLLTEAEAVAEHHGDPLLISSVAYQCAESQLVLGNLATAADLAGAALDRALKAGLERHYSAEFLAFCRVEALTEAGRLADAEAVVSATAEATSVSSAALARAYLEVLAGDHEAATARLTEIEAAMSPINLTDGEYVVKRGEIELWLGRPADALARVRELPDGISATLLFGFTGSALRVAMQACADLAEIARTRNDADGDETARRRAQELVAEHDAMHPDPFAPHPYWSFAPAEGASWRAELTRLSGTPDPAVWAEAADEWARLGRPHRTAYARWRQGEAFLAGGHRTEAARALRAAADGADGNAPLLAGIQETARLARLSPHAEQPAAGSTPYGLTAREQAVLALIAEGLTNVRIGRRLFISESTVSVHVTNLMRKLGVTNRAHAAALAQRAGLLPDQRAEH